MNTNTKFLHIVLYLAIFIILPSIFFILVQIPKRTILKDFLSIITVLAFFIVLGQFYLSRMNEKLKDTFKAVEMIKVHKILGYIVLPILILHPFLIVVPRFFEASPNPFDSFIKMITTLDSLSIILGVIAWVLMMALGLTSIFRNKLNMTYKSWKILHGFLSVIFIIFASWHAIETGRHMSIAMSILLILITSIASIEFLFYTNKKIIKNEKVKNYE